MEKTDKFVAKLDKFDTNGLNIFKDMGTNPMEIEYSDKKEMLKNATDTVRT